MHVGDLIVLDHLDYMTNPTGLRPPDAPLHVGLQGAERALVPLDRQLQHLQQPFGRVQVADDALRDDDRLAWNAGRL
jgi:hypothetical protein